MRKVICIVCIVLAAMTLLLASPLPGQAGGPRFHGGIWIGPGPGWWGPGPWWGPPAYWGSPYPYYATPPGIVQQQSPAYIQPAPQPEESNYWYYCQDTQTYYPYVKQCPSAWMKVVPSPASPGR